MVGSVRAILLIWLVSASAAAAPELVLQVATSWQDDSNPLRTPESQSVVSTRVLGNDIRAGLVLPLLSERTRLVLGVAQGDAQYHGTDQLSHQTHAWDAALEWAYGDLFNGRLIASDDQSLYSYSDGSLTQLDLAHTAQQATEVSLKVSPELSFPVRVEQTQFHYDLIENQWYDSSQKASQIGLLYESPTGSQVQFGMRSSNTVFTQRTPAQILAMDSSLHDSELFADVDWKYSVKTGIRMRVGVIEREYPDLTAQDTRLVSAMLTTSYAYSPQLLIKTQLWDRPYPFISSSVLYMLAKGARLSAAWAWSEKVHLRGFVSLQHDDLINTPTSPSSSSSEQERRAGLMLDYLWQPNMRFFAEAQLENQLRMPAYPNIAETRVRVGLEYTFENSPGAAKNNPMSRFQPYFW